MALLAICIPTYNRGPFLDELLNHISDEISCVQDRSWLQVCISDNASTDNTQAVVEAWQTKGIFPIRYERNPTNLGADRNFLKCVSIADAEYCWIMGSDDAVMPGSLKMVFDYLCKNMDISVFLMDYVACDVSLNPIREKDWGRYPPQDRVYDFSLRKDIENYLDCAGGLGALCAYLSAVIFRKSCWDAVKDDERYIGTVYVHAYKLLSILFRQQTKLLYIRKALVKNRGGNDSFFLNRKQRILLDLTGFLRISVDVTDDPGLQKEIRRILRAWLPSRVFKRLILQDLANTYDHEFFAILRQAGYSRGSLMFLQFLNAHRKFFHGVDGFLSKKPRMS